ncbi:adrenocorticotropic hormone receptor-like [Xenia sp. Carnegie-2017]|uniref:adrenocorticotropic hormone receptor-like n=1 Tax=Xenia sp. Carnegie-2017 TaxID=2897299 RepID=UPI001F03C610|nr:adrenocorticotropic hormone receptor-like [Xenia sp. Carnegie-2017]
MLRSLLSKEMNNSHHVEQSLNFYAAFLQFSINIVGILNNFLLLYAHAKDPYKILKRCHFIINVGVVDFIGSLLLFLYTTLVLGRVFNLEDEQLISRISNRVASLFFAASLMSFLSLAIERFLSVVYPLWHKVHVSNKVCRYWLTGMWLFVFSTELLRLLKESIEFVFIQLGLYFVGYCTTNMLYFATYISIVKQRKALEKSSESSRINKRAMQIRLRNEKSFLSTVAIVCAFFTVIYSPTIVLLVLLFLKKNRLSYIAQNIITRYFPWVFVMVSLNFAIYVPIYVWRLPKYRKTFKKLYFRS